MSGAHRAALRGVESLGDLVDHAKGGDTLTALASTRDAGRNATAHVARATRHIVSTIPHAKIVGALLALLS